VPDSLCFYLADPATNLPRFISAGNDALAARARLEEESRGDGREPVHRWIGSLRPARPLLVTLPLVDATVNEQLDLWHTIYDRYDLLSQPPTATVAGDDLIAKYSDWVNLEHRQIAPVKPFKERRSRRPPRKSGPELPAPEPALETESKPKPKPAKLKGNIDLGGVPARYALIQCKECDFFGKFSAYQKHKEETGHADVTVIHMKEADATVLAEFERNREQYAAKVRAQRFRCDECGMETSAGGMNRHQGDSGHTGRTKM
jgi:hypothetical protein